MKATHYLFAAVAASLLLVRCKDKEEDQPEDFKKEEIMTNLADNYIIPGYTALQSELNGLAVSWSAFVASPDQAHLDAVRSDWQTANVTFQKVKVFELGPAMNIGLSAALGTFPADTTQIESNVTAGSYNLGTAANIDAIGFESLDFLLYGHDALNKLTTTANRRTYVTDVIAKMLNEVNTVVNSWNSGYRATFIAGTGTSSTSAFSLLVNSFCKDYEMAKAAKLGIPIGTQTLGIQQPLYQEARRSGFGKMLLAANIEAIRSVFLGRSWTGNSNGSGFDDYLSALDKSSLASTIDTRFAYMETQPGSWSGAIEDMMDNSPATLEDFYDYMQGTVVYIKTDMASAFGVLITYQDNDGD